MKITKQIKIQWYWIIWTYYKLYIEANGTPQFVIPGVLRGLYREEFKLPDTADVSQELLIKEFPEINIHITGMLYTGTKASFIQKSLSHIEKAIQNLK